MQTFCKTLFLILLLIVAVETSYAQDVYPVKNIGFHLKGAFLEEEPSYYGIEFFHEWRLLEFLGLEVGGGFESSDNFSGLELISNSLPSDNIDYCYLKGKATYMDGKITGYLPILYNDDDYIDLQLFGSFFSGVASLRLSGQIDIHDSNEPIINKAEQRTHLFYGFDFGVVGAFSDRFAIRLFIGGNSINYSKPKGSVNNQLANYSFKYRNIENEPYLGVGLVYRYQVKER